MKITNISHCNNKLNFTHWRSWPVGWPNLIWKGVQLTQAPSGSSDVYLDASEQEIESLLKSIYPQLTFIELVLCLEQVEDLALNLNIEKLFAMYNLRWNENVEKTVKVIKLLPKVFHTWCFEKSISEGDLSALRSVQDVKSIFSALVSLANFSFTKNEGIRILELIIENSLLGHDIEYLSSTILDKELFLSSLTRLRYPMATEQLNKQKKMMADLPWPKGVTVKPMRQGDKSGFEIRFFAQSGVDIEKFTDGLFAVKKCWDQNG